MYFVAYHIDRCIRETSEIVSNGMTEIYVYAKARDGSDLSKLMEVFTEPDKYDFERFPATSKRKHQFKETEKGEQAMCNIVEQYAQSVAQNAVEEMLQGLVEERVQEKTSDLQYQLTEAQEHHYKSFFALVSKGKLSPKDGADSLGISLDDFLVKMTVI